MKFAFDGQFKDSDNKVKVGCILNWLGDEAFLIYGNLTFTEPAHKELPDKVLDAFSNYLKPEMNVFHSWYTLGSIYSNQFKTQSDFYNRLQCVAKECNFSSCDKVVKFLFLTHNNNTCVHEDLLKEMKEDTTLATMLNIAQISEGTIHSKELSKQYLDTIKVRNKQIDSVKKSRSKSGSRNKSHSTSCGGACGNCGSKHPPRRCKALGVKCHGCGKIILSQCADPGIDLSLKAKGTLTIHMLPINLRVVSRIKAKTDLVMISMRSTTRITLSLAMNKTQSLWCLTHSLGIEMWCLMKYLHSLHCSVPSLTCMFQMVQRERHFISKWTLVRVVIYYHTTSTNRLQDTKLIWTFCAVPLITFWILLLTTTRKSSNWVHVLCMFLVVSTQEWWNFLLLTQSLTLSLAWMTLISSNL